MDKTLVRPQQHRSLYLHVTHPHLVRRAKNGAPTVAGTVEKMSVNMRLAAWGTRVFGSMPMFYAFVVYGALGALFVAHQAALLYWSNWIQLWSLPLLMVGGIVLGKAHDRMSKQQFDDTELLLHGQTEQANHSAAQDDQILTIVDRLDDKTEGGIKAVLDAVNALQAQITGKEVAP
jgi:dethiobiotin synthetase